MVAIVSVIGFQGWFGEFSSSVLVGVESDSEKTLNSLVKVENLIGETLYVNSGDNLSISSITIGGINCNINSSYSGLAKINVSGCVQNVSGSAEIIIVTGDKVLESFSYISGDRIVKVL